jgi:hypothetical protein
MPGLGIRHFPVNDHSSRGVRLLYEVGGGGWRVKSAARQHFLHFFLLNRKAHRRAFSRAFGARREQAPV